MAQGVTDRPIVDLVQRCQYRLYLDGAEATFHENDVFLGGVFYSAALLPEPFQTLTRFDPVYYMIGLVRYGFLGYSDQSIPLSLLFLVAASAGLFAINYRLFARGYRLRA